MNNFSNLVEEMALAVKENFVVLFDINEGILSSQEIPGKSYHIKDVEKKVYPCPSESGNLYRITTKDDKRYKGTFFTNYLDEE